LRAWLPSKFAAHTVEVMAAVCLAFAAAGLVLGALVPWPLLQNASAEFVGGLLAGLVIFGLADVAFGFTERREKERHALEIAHAVLYQELVDNLSELQRIADDLREGSLSFSDPVFGADERLSAENWQALVQSPLVSHLSPELCWSITHTYNVGRRSVRNLREMRFGVLAVTPERWNEMCQQHLSPIESGAKSLQTTLDVLRVVPDSKGRSHAMSGSQ
jgi:hypothetical protein